MLRSAYLRDFTCLGEQCEDTCCKGWGMQITKQTLALYQAEAPELLEAVSSGEAELIMKRDTASDFCVKFQSGLCSIHRDYGTRFLGDACHFFPRITRQVGQETLMSAALSCPEIARLALFGNAGFVLESVPEERTPYSLKQYAPDGLDAEQTLAIHQAFMDAALDQNASAERIFCRISSVARSLEMQPVAQWPQAVPFYLKMADGRLAVPETALADPFNLLHLLNTLISAAKLTPRPRLEATLTSMAHALCALLERNPVNIHTTEGSLSAWQHLQQAYAQHWFLDIQFILKRWLATQLTMAFFPFSGFGETLTDRVTTLGVRFATVKLALLATCHVHGGVPAEHELVRVVQSLSRFMDHLADPTLSLDLYRQTGWIREARLRALIGDTIAPTSSLH